MSRFDHNKSKISAKNIKSFTNENYVKNSLKTGTEIHKNLHCAVAPALPQRKKTLLTDIAFATACNVAR